MKLDSSQFKKREEDMCRDDKHNQDQEKTSPMTKMGVRKIFNEFNKNLEETEN